ncbi:MAG: hypothetical protein IJS26_06270 [Alphaproteobacteria bacterium]|nr:hypothetical protein [Alphaproteobacteria bacterium]
MKDLFEEINYDNLINKHLLGVVHDALEIASKQGLPAQNHFYLTFKTSDEGVKIPKMLKTQYPQTMTIVLQHQFSNLVVTDEKFSVELVFGGVPYTLVVPFASIIYFADPYAKFGLSFEPSEPPLRLEDIDVEKKNSSSKKAEVISIDSFRNKK